MATARETMSWPGKATLIDVASADELLFWTKRFRVSAVVLKKVVQIVGPKFKDVAVFLHQLRRV